MSRIYRIEQAGRAPLFTDVPHRYLPVTGKKRSTRPTGCRQFSPEGGSRSREAHIRYMAWTQARLDARERLRDLEVYQKVLREEYIRTSYRLSLEAAELHDGRALREAFLVSGEAFVSAITSIGATAGIKTFEELLRTVKKLPPGQLKKSLLKLGGDVYPLIDSIPPAGEYDAVTVTRRLCSLRDSKMREYVTRASSLYNDAIDHPELIVTGGVTRFWIPLILDANKLVNPVSWALLADDLITSQRIYDKDLARAVFRSDWVSRKNAANRALGAAEHILEVIEKAKPQR